MIPGYATAEATTGYSRRFLAMPGHFRKVLDLTISSIGIGTYLGESDEDADRGYREAIRAALLGGINLIDTAVNYRFQRSERVIGKVLAELIGNGHLRRDEFVVATKGGYLTFDGGFPADPRAYFEEQFIKPGLIQAGELVDGSHCIAPRFLEAMIETSRRNLGLRTIDVYYLHNPEAQLEAVDRAEFLGRMRTAFQMLERKVEAGAIRFYGAATWGGFRVDPGERGYLSLAELLKAAREAGGEGHHFRMIQFPLNFAMPEALVRPNQEFEGERCTLLDAARRAGVAVCASASLLQGRLAHNLPASIAQVLRGLDSDAQRSLQFVRSAPGLGVALVGMKSVGHVLENLATAKRPLAPLDAFQKLFQTNPRE